MTRVMTHLVRIFTTLPASPARHNYGRWITASAVAALACFTHAAAADTAPVPVLVAMVRIEVATQNPAVNQTYELEIDSFDGQSLRGFEPVLTAGSVRSLISIDMGSVRSLQFFQRSIERAAPPARVGASPSGDPTEPGTEPGHPTGVREPSKDLLRRFDHLVRDVGEAQLARIFETLKSPTEVRQLHNHLLKRAAEADSPEELQTAMRIALLVNYLENCTAAARNFENTTSTQYFAEMPQFLRAAQTETAQLARRLESPDSRDRAIKAIDAQDFRMIAKPLAERVWNQSVPPERAVQPQRRMGNGNGPRPFKNNPRLGRQPD